MSTVLEDGEAGRKDGEAIFSAFPLVHYYVGFKIPIVHFFTEL